MVVQNSGKMVDKLNKYETPHHLFQFSFMKVYILSISLSLVFFSCSAQNIGSDENKKTLNLGFINNEKIQHSIVLMSCDTCVPIRNIGYRVIVQLSKKEKETIKKITPGTWTELLNKNKSDWAANLILYSLYDKNAILLSRNDSKETWEIYLKEEDLKFWNKEFSAGTNAAD
jgi:hypothetical protein